MFSEKHLVCDEDANQPKKRMFLEERLWNLLRRQDACVVCVIRLPSACFGQKIVPTPSCSVSLVVETQQNFDQLCFPLSPPLCPPYPVTQANPSCDFCLCFLSSNLPGLAPWLPSSHTLLASGAIVGSEAQSKHQVSASLSLELVHVITPHLPS